MSIGNCTYKILDPSFTGEKIGKVWTVYRQIFEVAFGNNMDGFS